MSRQFSLRGLAAVIGLAALTSCLQPESATLNVAGAATRGAIFDRYVAIGNSITAGYMGGGIVDSSQRRSYAFLLAQSMGTRFAYPSLNAPGCPPITTSLAGVVAPPPVPPVCALRATASASDLLNNVAVPGATSLDPTTATTSASNALTTLFLGGKTQVQKAIEVKPTFVSIWIGNNDVLGPAVSGGATTNGVGGPGTGTLGTITSQATFTARYDAMLNQLRAAEPGLKGVLIGVVNVANAPVMFPSSAFATASFKTAFDNIACGAATSACFGSGTTTVTAACTTAPTNTTLINTFLAFQIRAGAIPTAIIDCPNVAGGGGNPAQFPVGDAAILDNAEQAIVAAKVTAFNDYIKGKAAEFGWAYYDPNPTLLALRTSGGACAGQAATTAPCVRNIPSFNATPLLTTFAFGTGMSTDGVHPSATAHIQLANEIIAVINAKYGTTLPNVF